jgi:nucleotide-binding universal stress UspA family protein
MLDARRFIMSTTKVLIAYDGSECADAALADLRRAGLPKMTHAIILSVVESWLPRPADLGKLGTFDYREEMLALTRRASERIGSLMPDWLVEPLIGFGSPATVIIEKADEWQPDLLVVGSHGRTIAGRYFFGSVSQKVALEARCTVRVSRGRNVEPDKPVRLIIGIDGSKGAEAAVDLVVARSWPQGSEVRLVSAMGKMPLVTSEPMLLQIAEWVANENARVTLTVESAEKKLQSAGLLTSVVMKEDQPARLLLGEAERWDADCIFVGARGVGRLERLMFGSVSSTAAARAHCSVEIVRTMTGAAGNPVMTGN